VNNENPDKTIELTISYEPTELASRLAAFSALMSNGRGIEDKSQEYILEKFLDIIKNTSKNYAGILDGPNTQKFLTWKSRWVREKNESVNQKETELLEDIDAFLI